MSILDVLVGRQAVYDRDDICGYELLFRSAGVVAQSRLSADQMTATVIYDSLSIGLDRIVGPGRILLAADRGVLTGQIPLLLPPDRTTIVVAQSVAADDDVVVGCRRLVEEGYRLAVNRNLPEDRGSALLPLADVVRVDVAMTPADQLPEIAEHAREQGATLFAVRVGSLEAVPSLVELGFELFQGHAFEAPRDVAGRTVTPTDVTRLTAASEVLRSAEDFEVLETLLRRDPGLTHQVIRLAAAGRLGETRRQINTIRDAMVMAGTRKIAKWLALLLARPATSGSRSRDAFLLTLQRARACETLAGFVEPAAADVAFAAGMISCFDLLFDVPLAEIASVLQLSDQLHEAAFGGQTSLAQLVKDAACYQTGRGNPETPQVLSTNLARADFDAAFAEAFGWALDSINASPHPSGRRPAVA